MNKLVFWFQPFVIEQTGKVFYRDDEQPVCDLTFRANDVLKFQELLQDYNIGEIEIHNSKMAIPFTNWVKKIDSQLNFTLKD